MNQIVEALQKAEHPLDQVLVGAVRVSRTIHAATKVCETLRAADLGEDSNAILDELIVLLGKAQLIAGTR